MIKIGFKNIDQAREDYPDLIADNISSRLLILKTSLVHIGVKPNKDDEDVRKFQAVTMKIINYFQTPNTEKPSSEFVKDRYEGTVSSYVAANKARLSAINYQGLIALIDHLTDKNNKVLKLLLRCSPERLHRVNNLLMSHHKVTSAANVFALTLGFDWKIATEVTNVVKSYYQKEKQVVHCPYCNISKAHYSELSTGQPSSRFALDHFYNKKAFPLLTFSMFNLVPIDDVCNGSTVKGEIPFSYDYHLNPYEAGMDRTRMIFKPRILKINDDPIEIVLSLMPPATERKYQQLVGNHPNIDETRKVGSINVFKIKQNYNEPFVLERAGSIQRKCESLFRSRRSLSGFLRDMRLKFDIDSYQRFYKDEFHTEFLPENFHRFQYSKLVRDIHDNVLDRDKARNNDIRAFVLKHNA